MKIQQFYNNVANSLRTHGNQYGGFYERGWSWVNPQNPNDRCAIARFIGGNTDFQVMENLSKFLNVEHKHCVQDQYPLVREVIEAFDSDAKTINNKDGLERLLKKWATKYKLKYKQPEAVVA